jgi:Cys-tRNA(Pro)/Cys-tRNA(Cys) deacylase
MAKREVRQPGTPATVALTRANVPYTAHVYDHDPAAPSYGMEAAIALAVPPDQVFKTLMAKVDDQPVIAIVPVSSMVDLKALAAAAGGRRAEMADPQDAQRITGYAVGGISPVGQRRQSPTYVDDTAAGLDVIYVSGGRRGFDIGLSPDDLLRMTSGHLAPIARAGRT